jgi:hypothetical protein
MSSPLIDWQERFMDTIRVGLLKQAHSLSRRQKRRNATDIYRTIGKNLHRLPRQRWHCLLDAAVAKAAEWRANNEPDGFCRTIERLMCMDPTGCRARTSDGTPCVRGAKDPWGRCWQHDACHMVRRRAIHLALPLPYDLRDRIADLALGPRGKKTNLADDRTSSHPTPPTDTAALLA